MRLGDLDYCVAGSESAWKSAAVTVGCRRGRSLGLGPDSSSESEPQSEAGPYQTVLGRERWPGPGDWPGFKWLARFQAELLRAPVCRDSVTDLNLEVGHGHGWPGLG